MRSLKIVGVCATLLITGCQMPQPMQPTTPQEVAASGTRYLQGGPTTEIDVTAQHPEPTTLRLLQEKTDEALKLRDALESSQSVAEEAEKRAVEAEKLAAERQQETQHLQKLLANALGDQKELSSEVVSSRIRMLRLEQQLLRLKLAGLAKGDN